MPRAATHDACPMPGCLNLKHYRAKVCLACYNKRAASSVQQQRNKRREVSRAEAMVGLLRLSENIGLLKRRKTPKPSPSTFEPVAAFDLLSLETGQPVKVKVGPSTAQFVQCPARPEGQAHRYQLDQANHGVCQDCGATRDWPRQTWDIGWGDDGAMTWE